MKRLSDGLPLVEGTSTPGSEHQVEVAQGRCGCTVGQFRSRRYHTRARGVDGPGLSCVASASRVTCRSGRGRVTRVLDGHGGLAAVLEAFGSRRHSATSALPREALRGAVPMIKPV